MYIGIYIYIFFFKSFQGRGGGWGVGGRGEDVDSRRGGGGEDHIFQRRCLLQRLDVDAGKRVRERSYQVGVDMAL